MKNFSVISIVFSILLVVFGLTLSAQSSDDKNACAYARKESNIDTWKFYLENFPNGECSDEAKAALESAQNTKDQIACNRARQQNSFEGWRLYLLDFPNGKCAFEAKVNKKKLKTSNDLDWSSRSTKSMEYNQAVSYCNNLTEDGYSDWRLPTISELRTQIKNCRGTKTGGSCGVTDFCLSSNCWTESACCSCGPFIGQNTDLRYSAGDAGWLWSSSTRSDNTGYAWLVHFSYGYVYNYFKSNYYYVRCVR